MPGCVVLAAVVQSWDTSRVHCMKVGNMEFVCFVWISEQTANLALRNIKRLAFITEVKSVYCAVRTESLYNTDMFCL